MSYPTDYINQLVSAGCPKCGSAPRVTRNAMGDAVLVCEACSWRSEPVDCGFGGALGDALGRRYQAAAEAAEREGRIDDAAQLRSLGYFYAGLRRAVY